MIAVVLVALATVLGTISCPVISTLRAWKRNEKLQGSPRERLFQTPFSGFLRDAEERDPRDKVELFPVWLLSHRTSDPASKAT